MGSCVCFVKKRNDDEENRLCTFLAKITSTDAIAVEEFLLEVLCGSHPVVSPNDSFVVRSFYVFKSD